MGVGVLVAACLAASSATAQRVYWTTEGDGIHRAALDGTGRERLLDDPGLQGKDIALDVAAGWMYFIDGGAIRRAPLDGGAAEDLVTGLPPESIDSLVLDPAGGKLYWNELFQSRVRRADLDGSDVEIFAALPGAFPASLALDLPAGRLYWTDSLLDRVQRRAVAGGAIETLASAEDFALGAAIDLAAGKLYWAAFGDDRVRRADLDGAARATVVDADDGVRGPRDVALGDGRVLWAEETAGRIGSARLDGSDVQGFPAPGVRGVAFDPRPLAPAVPLWPWAPER